MKFMFLAAAFLAAFTIAAAAQMPDPPIKRPKITGVSNLGVYTSNAGAAGAVYRESRGAGGMPSRSN
jgi:hypothetical protein